MVKSLHPFVSVIIPVFNDTNRLLKCLQSLAQQTYPQGLYEVIVVDNSPSPDPNLLPLPDQFPNLVLAHEPRAGSYSARNHGLNLAQGTIMAFTDSDCLPNLDWVEKGVNWLTQNPNCGLVAGQIRFFFRDPKSPTVPELYDSLHFLQQKTYVEEYHFGATANLFTFKARFEEIGLFNSDLLSGGDKDWSQRVFSAGYSLLYADDVIIRHPARHSFQEVRTKIIRVTTGYHNLSGANDRSFGALLAEVLPDLKPHIRYAIDRFQDPKIQGWRRKLGCYLIYIAMRYIRTWKRIQLYLSYHLNLMLKPTTKKP